ncbi:YciI family protein [Streptantibioticus ferralitis]|uniref:YciI family protein n=1 Tax=Streptantibioticus ferralitis TaxID=236510 RepID=A0ABT5Z6R6_9ACTN|nr:YciI family protein [Streptantibioticus ferralitis]MDF2259231.1 YciI family protein [Streptantibioticus ferralitis]
MFVVDLTYTAPLERVDAALADHVAWLEKQYDTGAVIASGRKEPRNGGILIVVAPDRAAVEALIATDPFSIEGVAEYRVTEFIATKTAPALERYREQLPG